MAKLDTTPTRRAREMAELWARCERSGARPAEFARRHGLNPGTFIWWRSELRRRSAVAAEPPVEFVEIGGPVRGDFELSFPNGIRMRVPPGCDPTVVARIAGALVQC